VIIREYEPSDLEACRQLWRDLTQRHRDIYDDQTIGGDDPGPYFDEHYLTLPNFHKVWVADEGGDLVGLCGLLDDGYEAELEPIIVRPSHRDRGVGAALAQHVIAEARKLGRRSIIVRPVGRNIEAIAFFKNAGFGHLNRVELSLSLQEGAGPSDVREVDLHGVTFRF
jgi:N-acetylglutamate synthase-like GNAT family acetyltransferase